MNKDKATHIPAGLIEKTLATEATEGKRLLGPLLAHSTENKVPVNILEDVNVVNNAEIHVKEADLWYCLEGEVDFICGGEMVDPWFLEMPDGTENKNEIQAKEIEGGESLMLKKGDWLFIPAGVPHKHGAKGTARMVIIKVPKV